MDGLRASTKRLPQIFAWALVSSVIGFILNALRGKKEGPMNFVVGLIGAGWAVAVYFVVPVLVSEKLGPWAAIKRSVSVIKKTWGEALVAEVGFGVFYGMIGFIIVLFVMAGAMLFEPYPSVSITILATGALFLILCGLVFSTLGSILKAALYVYAVEGKLPDQFDPDLIKGAFKSEN